MSNPSKATFGLSQIGQIAVPVADIDRAVAFYRDTLKPVPYEGENGIGALLNRLADRFGWERVYEGENVIALKQGLASISLEPGGQFELSGAPLETVHDTCAEVNEHLQQVREIGDALGIGFTGVQCEVQIQTWEG